MKTAGVRGLQAGEFIRLRRTARRNSLGKGTLMHHCDTEISTPLGRIITKEWGGMRGNWPLHCGMRGSRNSIRPRPFRYRTISGAGRATGCSLLRKSGPACVRTGFHRDPIARDSITCFTSRGAGAEDLFRKRGQLLPQEILRIVPGRSGTSPVIDERAYWKWISGCRVKRRGKTIECAGMNSAIALAGR